MKLLIVVLSVTSTLALASCAFTETIRPDGTKERQSVFDPSKVTIVVQPKINADK